MVHGGANERNKKGKLEAEMPRIALTPKQTELLRGLLFQRQSLTDRINELTVMAIESAGFETGTASWALTPDGSAIVQIPSQAGSNPAQGSPAES